MNELNQHYQFVLDLISDFMEKDEKLKKKILLLPNAEEVATKMNNTAIIKRSFDDLYTVISGIIVDFVSEKLELEEDDFKNLKNYVLNKQNA